jgi:hypothetical protein
MREKFVHYLNDGDHRAGYNLSWGAIFAGIVTFLALFIIFSTIGSAVGFGVLDFMSGNPFSGLGTTAIIWIILSALLSFFGAGFVSGVAARRVGLLHGFVTWAANLVVSVIFIGLILSSLLSLAGSAISTTADVAGDAVGAGADAATTAVTEGFQSVSENVNIDQEEMEQQTVDVLEGTEIEELQPEYIQNQLDEAGTDIQEAGQEIITNPDNADQVVSNLGDSLSSRAEDITQEVDEEAISNSVEENTDLTGQEAEEATQNIVQTVEQSGQQAQEALDSAQSSLRQVRQDISGAVQQLQSTAQDASNVSAWSLVGLFVGHIILAIVSSIGGLFGSNLVKQSPQEESV